MQLGRSLYLHLQSEKGRQRIFRSFTRARALCSPPWYYLYSRQKECTRGKNHKLENGGRGICRHRVATETQELLCWIRLVSTNEKDDENVWKESDVEKVVKLEKCWTLWKVSSESFPNKIRNIMHYRHRSIKPWSTATIVCFFEYASAPIVIYDELISNWKTRANTEFQRSGILRRFTAVLTRVRRSWTLC